MSRYVTAASLSSDAYDRLDQDALVEFSRATICGAAARGADILAFPEVWCQLPLLNRGMGYCATAEPIPGPHSQPILDACAAAHLAAVWPMFERRGDDVFNTAVFVSAEGKIVARRDKLYLTDKEIDDGVRHGRMQEKADLPFGRVGSAICFDANFREVWAGLKEDGAELVLFPSMFQATRHLAARSLEFGYYILSAITKPGEGQLLGQCGELLGQAQGENLLVGRINLDRRVVHMDNNFKRAASAIRARYRDAVRVDPIDSESRFSIEVLTDGLDVESVLREFEIEPIDAYYRRMRKTRGPAAADDPEERVGAQPSA